MIHEWLYLIIFSYRRILTRNITSASCGRNQCRSSRGSLATADGTGRRWRSRHRARELTKPRIGRSGDGRILYKIGYLWRILTIAHQLFFLFWSIRVSQIVDKASQLVPKLRIQPAYNDIEVCSDMENLPRHLLAWKLRINPSIVNDVWWYLGGDMIHCILG